MRTRNHTIIRCDGCGQVYHVPSSAEERRGKCRPCGNEFVIPAAVTRPGVKARTKPSGQAAADRYAAAQIASLTSRQVTVGGRSYRRTIAVIGGALVLGIFAILTTGFKPRPEIKPAVDLHLTPDAKLPLPHQSEYASTIDLIKAIEPSVVQIETTRGGIGSGFVLDKSGLIATCYHCIEGADGATALFANGQRLKVLGTVAVAPHRDIAILAVEPSDSFLPLALASKKPKKGEPIVAMGSPGGLSFSECAGSVSSLRTVADLSTIDNYVKVLSPLAPTVSLVQVNAPIMPGNSGGPVVDFSGNVIGINSFLINWRGQMYAFCIAASEIQRVAASLDKEVTPL
jgi:S1-C subfamily serine protease